ncbi:PRXIIB [Linum grandiflorum]
MSPIAQGDTIPEGTLMYIDENEEFQNVSLHSLGTSKKIIIFAVPGAFTPGCRSTSSSSSLCFFSFLTCCSCNMLTEMLPFVFWASLTHVPGFIEKAEEIMSKGVSEILLLSVNDPFVMKAWGKTYPDNRHVKFLSDGSAAYTQSLGLELDATDKGFGVGARRFALLVDDLKVKVANIEEGGNLTAISSAEEILKAL